MTTHQGRGGPPGIPVGCPLDDVVPHLMASVLPGARLEVPPLCSGVQSDLRAASWPNEDERGHGVTRELHVFCVNSHVSDNQCPSVLIDIPGSQCCIVLHGAQLTATG